MSLPRVLICAGSDSGGGAGIQADIKTVTALRGFAMTAITALTAQNTQGVFGVVGVEPNFVRQQMRLVLTDLGADAVKTGMLHDVPVIEAVAEILAELAPTVPLVVDPVMVAKGGAALLANAAVAALKARLIPHATVLTPNLPEAEVLIGHALPDVAAMQAAAEGLRALGATAVLIKGGHLPGPILYDVLASGDGIRVFESPRIATAHTHGTGCTLASAIATGLAEHRSLIEAVARARAYVRQAILTAPHLGHGHGPLNHGHTVSRF
jgi:hydroxymethylpyrimidine/phosphomethylpyrimidine kinase